MNKKLVALGLLLIIVILATVVWQRSWYGQAYALEMMAGRFPPSSIQAKRFRAMAEAIREGKKTYTFTTTGTPSLGEMK